MKKSCPWNPLSLLSKVEYFLFLPWLSCIMSKLVIWLYRENTGVRWWNLLCYWKYSNTFKISVESNSELRWLCFSSLCNWSTKHVPSSQPIRCEPRTNYVLITNVFLEQFAFFFSLNSLWLWIIFPLLWLAVVLPRF